MCARLALLLLFLQLCHLATPSEIPDVYAASNELGKCISSCSEFPIKIGNKLYQIESSKKVSWYQAAHNCRKWGGHLLNLETSNEMDLIAAITPSKSFWVSANCLATEGDFVSVATGKAMPYVRWIAGQPDNESGKEFCVSLETTGLNDKDCDSLLNYVCQANLL